MTRNKLFEDYSENVALIDRLLSIDKSFDMLSKKITLESGELTLYFIDGFAKDTVLQKLMMHILSTKKLKVGAREFMETTLPYIETDVINATKDYINKNNITITKESYIEITKLDEIEGTELCSKASGVIVKNENGTLKYQVYLDCLISICLQ